MFFIHSITTTNQLKSISYYSESLCPIIMKPTSALVTVVALLGGHAAALPAEPSSQNNAREITDVQSRELILPYPIEMNIAEHRVVPGREYAVEESVGITVNFDDNTGNPNPPPSHRKAADTLNSR